jgi:hypothetical protein
MLAWQKVSSESMNVRGGTVSDRWFLKHEIWNDQEAYRATGGHAAACPEPIGSGSLE